MLASLKRLFLRLFSRPSLAPIFIGIRKIGGYGLNYNAAALLDVESSGEGKALDYMLSKLPRGQRLTLFDVGASVGDYIEPLFVDVRVRIALVHLSRHPRTKPY